MFAFCLIGCLEKEEGCLDPNALNLDVTADVNGGCNYPSIRFNVSHRWISPPAEHDSTILFGLNQLFNVPATDDSVIFSSIRFYLSNVSLSGDVPLIVSDSVLLNDGSYILDDLILLSGSSFQFATGDINRFGSFNGIEFDVGYEEDWPKVDTTFLLNKTGNHVWMNQDMITERKERYNVHIDYTVYGKDLGGMPDTTSRSLGLVHSELMHLTKSGSFNIEQAQHANVSLVIDYRKLFDGIDLKNDADADVMNTFMLNIDEALNVIN